MVVKSEFRLGHPCWAVHHGAPQRAFYEGLFGWTLPEGSDQGAATRADRAVAGFAPDGEPHWCLYFRASDIRVATDRAIHAGASVTASESDEQAERSSLVDPLGARFGLWEPRQRAGFGEVLEPGCFCWAELATSDFTASADFYREALGWGSDEGTHEVMEYLVFRADGKTAAGAQRLPDAVAVPGLAVWLVYFLVESLDQSLGDVARLGGSVVTNPREVPEGTFSIVADPAGAVFSLLEPAPR